MKEIYIKSESQWKSKEKIIRIDSQQEHIILNKTNAGQRLVNQSLKLKFYDLIFLE